ncbi:enoyl-CoA hydratase-related protein [Amycolatopsis sp. 195334CR]|uniref:enoyl-CoA hydratase-related protein n=1 Tax=Amycolatopsis sp. 195334CR TaxID=2814588 RepID=UPI001A9077CD|nr:enoyl-CoA hydratase-related protein [Amycolatopsis sp. 195334CR]MBN6040684.1 enoyl-CoA hydratase/isomerase family protein [Amycolatopsis sp. 195334CR]
MSETTLVDGVRYALTAGVATLTFERPERHNAMDPAMRTRYGKVLRAAEQDPAVRAVVVTGDGRSFCPGADLDALAGIGATGVADQDLTAEDGGYADVLAAATVAKPVVAAINGGCAGLGFVVACAADVRFAAAGAKFTTAFVRRGLIAEYGIAKLLPELVGRGRALDLLLSGRTFTAEQALDYGLVQEVLPPEDLLAAATAYAGELATYSAPRSMALIKDQLREEAALPLAESARRATELMLESFDRPELAEGVRSWNERRPPAFPPYPSES